MQGKTITNTKSPCQIKTITNTKSSFQIKTATNTKSPCQIKTITNTKSSCQIKTATNTKSPCQIKTSRVSGTSTKKIADILPEKNEVEPSSKKERWGWYCYDWANSVYFQVIITLMGPLFINHLASLKSYGDIKWCNATEGITDINYTSATYTIQNYTYDANFEDLIYPPSCEAFNNMQPEGAAPNKCLLCFARRGTLLYDCEKNSTIHSIKWEDPGGTVAFGPFSVPAFTFTSSVLSASVFIQALMFIMTGPCADYGTNRKMLLIVSACIGIGCCIAMFFIWEPDQYAVGGLVLMISNVAMGMAIVFYNAYLPLLAESHPETLAERKKAIEENDPDVESRVCLIREGIERKMSDFGFALGYIAGLLLLVACIPLVVFMPEGEGFWYAGIDYRLSILISAIWWLLFSIPTFLFLRPRGGPPLPESKLCGKNPLRVLIFGFEQFGMLFSLTRKYKHTLLFLVCYFIYSDSYSTIASVGVLFGSEELCMSTIELIPLPIIIALMCIAGIYFYQGLATWKCTQCSSKMIIIINLIAFMVMCLYGCIGFLESSPIGLTKKWEMYAFAFLYGFHLGPIQSYTRTAFTDLIPKGKESEFFALYEISDKGSSWIGPLVVGILKSATGSIRFSFVYLLLVLVIPILMLTFCIDFVDGAHAVGNAAAPEKSQKSKSINKVVAATQNKLDSITTS